MRRIDEAIERFRKARGDDEAERIAASALASIRTMDKHAEAAVLAMLLEFEDPQRSKNLAAATLAGFEPILNKLRVLARMEIKR